MRVVLIGFMGSGKSSIAKLLHEKLHFPIKDTDLLIEAKWGKKIPAIFKDEGEEKFREYETQILKDLLKDDSVVIATGGGIIEKEVNHALLKSNSVVFYLRTTPENVLKFTAGDKNRPLLQVKDPLSFVTEKLNKREPKYIQLSDFQVDTYNQSLEASTATIINYLKLYPPFNLC